MIWEIYISIYTYPYPRDDGMDSSQRRFGVDVVDDDNDLFMVSLIIYMNGLRNTPCTAGLTWSITFYLFSSLWGP
jgi:hypothetical protein